MLSMVAAAAAQSSSPGQTQQQHATPRIKVKGRRRVKSRTSYSLSLKLRAVEEAERSGLRAAAVSLQLDERVLRQWVTKAEELRQAGLTNAGSTRRLRSRSASMGKQPVAGSSPDDEVNLIVLPFITFLFNNQILFTFKNICTKTYCDQYGLIGPTTKSNTSYRQRYRTSEFIFTGCDTTCRIGDQWCPQSELYF